MLGLSAGLVGQSPGVGILGTGQVPNFLYRDLFNAADGTAVAGRALENGTGTGAKTWTVTPSTADIQSNRLHLASGTFNRVVSDFGLANGVSSEVAIKTLADFNGSILGYTNTNNFFYAQTNGTAYNLGKIVSGSSTSIRNVPKIPQAGDIVALRRYSNNVIQMLINGWPWAETTDSFNSAATIHGILQVGSVARLDDFYLRNILPYVAGPAALSSPVPLIIDTDLSSDVGDVGALGVAHSLVKNGEASILAVVTNSANIYSASCAYAINKYYGRLSIPIGAYQGSTPSGAAAASTYTQTITTEFGTPGDSRANYPAAVTVLRTALAAAADNSVVYCSIGFAQNIQALLQSPADGISALTGVQLVAQKVNRMSMMAGDYPNSASPEFNFANDAANWAYVMANWPSSVPIVATGFTTGNTIFNGPAAGADPATNLIKRAFNLATYTTRQSWDQLPILYAVRNTSTNFFYAGVNGANSVNSSTGANTWNDTRSGNYSVFWAKATDLAIGAVLDGLLQQAP